MESDIFSFKQCFSCRLVLPVGEFYRAADGSCGSSCKQCLKLKYEQNKEVNRAKGKEHYYNNIERYREYYKQNREKLIDDAREYRRRKRENMPRSSRYESEAARERHNNETQRYKKRHPERVKAYSAVAMAIRKGLLQPVYTQSCATCGKTAAVYHHWSYSEEHWLDVIPLCIECHGRVHSKDTD